MGILKRRNKKMAKLVKMTPEIRKQCEKEFEDSLVKARESFSFSMSNHKMAMGKINIPFGKFEHVFDAPDSKANLHFTAKAWLKMNALVSDYSSEVGWHGIAYRDTDETKNDYYITDVLVYPQVVDGTNVNTDQVEYQTWLNSLDDESFNNLRMQGHSHVNMGVTPSAVDETHQERILDMLEDDMFYVFMIWNKRNENTIRIYDLKKNILFEPKDISVVLPEDIADLPSFLKSSRDLVKTRYSNYYSYYAKGGTQQQTPAKQLPITPAKEEKKETPVAPKSAASAPPVKEKKTKASAKSGKDYYKEFYGYCDDDDDYDSPFYSYDGFFRGGKR